MNLERNVTSIVVEIRTPEYVATGQYKGSDLVTCVIHACPLGCINDCEGCTINDTSVDRTVYDEWTPIIVESIRKIVDEINK
jgi:hypothetical protein